MEARKEIDGPKGGDGIGSRIIASILTLPFLRFHYKLS